MKKLIFLLTLSITLFSCSSSDDGASCTCTGRFQLAVNENDTEGSNLAENVDCETGEPVITRMREDLGETVFFRGCVENN